MSTTQTIDLRGRVPEGELIEFMSVEVSLAPHTPLVIVRYKENGEEQQYGLRLDLDKSSFLDHFDDANKERLLREAVHPIADVIEQTLRPRIFEAKLRGKAERLPYYEKTYSNFSSLREKIMQHIKCLEDGGPITVSAAQINASIDDLLLLMQIMTGTAEHDDDFRTYLEQRNFFPAVAE